MIDITHNSFSAEVEAHPGLVVLDLYADWCGPCRMLKPILAELEEEYPEVKFCKINVDEDMEPVMAYRVVSIPAFIFFKDGEEVARKVGVLPGTEFTAVLDNYLN